MQEQLPRVLSFPYPLRFLFASRPGIMGQVLGISHIVSSPATCQFAQFQRGQPAVAAGQAPGHWT